MATCFGFVRLATELFGIDIPEAVISIVFSFYGERFTFDASHEQFEVSADGLTQSTIKSTLKGGRPTNQFGDFLCRGTFECTLRLDAGFGSSGLFIGFIAKGFDEFVNHSDGFGTAFTPKACLAAANGYFKIDTAHFTCEAAQDRKHYNGREFMGEVGETVTVKVDMERRMGSIGSYEIGLPDNVAIVVSSTSALTLTVIQQMT